MNELGLLGFFGSTFIALGLAFYLLPTLIAAMRKKTSLTGILLVNLFLGWTVIGWFVALIWAATTQAVDNVPPIVGTAFQQPRTGRLCANCGKYSVSDAGFCSYCGKSFS